MTTLTQATDERMQDARTWARNDLMRAQRMFNKKPNATHWEVCIRAMLVFQQVDWAVRSPRVDHVALLLDLDHAPVGQWGDIVTRHTLGMSIASALA